MIAWIGVGFALISSILFSCAAICLRREREKEEAVNMQYLMPGECTSQPLRYTILFNKANNKINFKRENKTVMQ